MTEQLLDLAVGLLAQARFDPFAEFGEGLEFLRDFHREVVVGVGQLFGLDIVDCDGEGDRLARDLFVVPIVGDLDRDHVLVADGGADQLLTQSRHADDRVFAQVELRALLIEDLLTVDFGVDIGRHAVVEFGRALDRFEHGVLAAQFEQALLQHVLGVFALRLGDGDAAVVAQLDHGRQGNGRLERDRLALGDFDAGLGDRFQAFLLQSLGQRLGNQSLGGLFEDGVGAERALDDAARRLALAEAGDAVALRQTAGGLVERFLDPRIVQLDFEQHLRLGHAFSGYFHGTPSQLASTA